MKLVLQDLFLFEKKKKFIANNNKYDILILTVDDSTKKNYTKNILTRSFLRFKKNYNI